MNMEKEIDGSKTLAQIERAIAGQETRFMEFNSSTLLAEAGNKKNVIEFDELDMIVPKKFKLTLIPASNPVPPPAPDGFQSLWTGKMFVAGKTENVAAWRKT